jgi:predicted peptidase
MATQKILKTQTGKYNLVVFTPNGYSAENKYPLVVVLCGINSKGDNIDLLYNDIPENIKRASNAEGGFVLIAVQTADTYDDEAVFARQYGIDNYSISTKHLTGFSYGGGGTWYVAAKSLEWAKLWDSIAPIATTWTQGVWKNIADANLPIWAFHNLKDNNPGTPCDATRTMVAEVNKIKPGLATMTLFNSFVHGGWDEAYNTVSPPIALGGEGLTNPTKTLWQWFKMNDSTVRIAPPGATVQTGLQPVLNVTIKDGTVYLDGSQSYGMKSAKLATVAVPDGVNIWGATIDGGGTAVGRIRPTVPGRYKFRLIIYSDVSYKGVTASVDQEIDFALQAPVPPPIESFKPTHIIKRIDGSSEQVRIETI